MVEGGNVLSETKHAERGTKDEYSQDQKESIEPSQKWRILELMYKTNIDRIAAQLQFGLIFRGWAITIFAGIIVVLFTERLSIVVIPGIVALLLFFYSEVKYDAYRIVFQKRANMLERFFQSRIDEMVAGLKLYELTQVTELPELIKAEATFDLGKAEKLSAKSKVRLLTYSLLIAALILSGAAIQLELI